MRLATKPCSLELHGTIAPDGREYSGIFESYLLFCRLCICEATGRQLCERNVRRFMHRFVPLLSRLRIVANNGVLP